MALKGRHINKKMGASSKSSYVVIWDTQLINKSCVKLVVYYYFDKDSRDKGKEPFDKKDFIIPNIIDEKGVTAKDCDYNKYFSEEALKETGVSLKSQSYTYIKTLDEHKELIDE